MTSLFVHLNRNFSFLIQPLFWVFLSDALLKVFTDSWTAENFKVIWLKKS